MFDFFRLTNKQYRNNDTTYNINFGIQVKFSDKKNLSPIEKSEYYWKTFYCVFFFKYLPKKV